MTGAVVSQLQCQGQAVVSSVRFIDNHPRPIGPGDQATCTSHQFPVKRHVPVERLLDKHQVREEPVEFGLAGESFPIGTEVPRIPELLIAIQREAKRFNAGRFD